MKTNHRFDYLSPSTQVIYVNFMKAIMVNSTIWTSSSESFQDESEYGSIW
jgi:hypothetical protein